MQGWRDDESLRNIKIADTLEELLPMIKKSLANPQVTCIRIFNARGGKRIQANEYKKDMPNEITVGIVDANAIKET